MKLLSLSIVLFCGLLTTGCYSVGNSALQSVEADALIGLTKDQLVKAYGPPSVTSVVTRNGKTVRSYTWMYAYADMTGSQSKVVIVDVDDNQIAVAISTAGVP